MRRLGSASTRGVGGTRARQAPRDPVTRRSGGYRGAWPHGWTAGLLWGTTDYPALRGGQGAASVRCAIGAGNRRKPCRPCRGDTAGRTTVRSRADSDDRPTWQAPRWLARGGRGSRMSADGALIEGASARNTGIRWPSTCDTGACRPTTHGTGPHRPSARDTGRSGSYGRCPGGKGNTAARGLTGNVPTGSRPGCRSGGELTTPRDSTAAGQPRAPLPRRKRCASAGDRPIPPWDRGHTARTVAGNWRDHS